MNYTYEIISPLTAYLNNPYTTLKSQDGWKFVESDFGYYLFENKKSGESFFYPVAQSLLRVKKEGE